MKSKYTKEKIEEVVKVSLSIATCLRNLGARPVGGNYKWLKGLIKWYNIDISHFTGQAWSKGKKSGLCSRTQPLNEILVEDSSFASSYKLKKRLFQEKIKDEICEQCLNTEWMGQPIPLELEHRNGVNTDHRIENLLILCPNCHAQTPFYRGKNKLSSLNERRKLNYVKFGETLTGNPEPSFIELKNNNEGVET
jgi:hypothetical protein